MKTKTTKKRKMEIYFPTKEAKEALLKAAEGKGLSASKYILSCLEEVQTGPMGGPVSKDLAKAQKEIRTLKAENETFRRENEQLLILTGRNTLEIELLRTKETPTRERPAEEGVHKLNIKLIHAFKTRGEIGGADIITEVGLDPMNMKEAQKIWRDLDTLMSHGLIEPTTEGWRWVGN